MKHFNTSTALSVLAALLLSVPFAANAFRKAANASGTVNMEKRVGVVSVSPKKYAVPDASIVPAEVANTGDVKFRGLVVNGSPNPYIGEFTLGETMSAVSVVHEFTSFGDPDDYYEEDEFSASGSAVYADGKFYVNTLYSPLIGAMYTAQYIYDGDTWELIEKREELLQSTSAICMTYDPLDCAVYGYFHNDDGGESKWFMFGRMNLATGDVRAFNSVDEDDGFMCIAASPDGFLYGVDVHGQYCRIDKSTGVITVLGHTDVKPQYIQSATIDWNTGKFYWAGFTDTGKGNLYEIDPNTYMAKVIAPMPQNQEFVALWTVEDTPEGDKAASVENIELAFEKDNLGGSVSFTVPTSTVDGSALGNDLKAHVAVDGKHYELPVVAGQKCTISDVKVYADDLYIFTAWISDDNGEGKKSTVQKWIGADKPEAVKNIKLENDNSHLTLTWEAPGETGIHGGYVNPAEVTYNIGREGGPFMSQISDYKECRLEQDLSPDVTDKISYYVRPIYKEKAGPVTYSPTVSVGNPVLTVPVDLNAAEIDKFIVIDADGNGNTWTKFWGYSTCDAPSDDWLLTPEIALKGGEVYELSYDVSAKMGFLSPQTLEVKMGEGSTVTDMTFDIDKQTVTTIQITKFETLSAIFTAPSDGNFRIGFHAATDGGGTLGMSSIKLKSLASAKGPIAPSSCKVVAAPEGELKAEISFKAPLFTAEGNDIGAIAKIEVFRGATLVGSVENPVAGESYSVTDLTPQQGKNKYEIFATDAEGVAGLKATAQGWVGLDIPSTPENVSMVEDGNDLVLAWVLPELGINGGYVNPAEVVYTIVEPNYAIELAYVKGATTARLPLGEMTRQSSFKLGVVASNEAGTNNEGALTPTVIAGPAYTLPFHEHFSPSLDYSWYTVGTALDSEGGWSPADDKGPDGQTGVNTYWGYWDDDEMSIISGKISLKDAKKPTLRFYLQGRIGEYADPGTFTVGISDSFNGEYKEIYSKIFEEENSGWLKVELPLDEYIGKEIYVSFTAVPEYGSFLIGIDDVTIREAIDYDIAMAGISMDRDEVEVGLSKAKVSARVQNHGVKDLAEGSYKVNFFAGDRCFASVDGKAMEANFGQSIYEVEYEPSVDDENPTIIKACVESANDLNPANDKSKELSIYVVKPVRPAVTDLAGSMTDEGIVLSWTQPDLSGLPVRSVLEDFESYRPWSNNKAGSWTFVDADRSPGCNVSYYFPGSNGPMGWVVMNPGLIARVGGGTHKDRCPPFSGEQYMVAYNPTSGDNDDWIITPELSGNAQRISFMARNESSKEGREMFEVYYSVAGNSIADMKQLDNISWRTELKGWSEFAFDVPEGTKYFAVRCISHNRVAMHIDDFTYESAATPLEVKFVGYNVYRDGTLLNDEPIATPSYVDANIHSDLIHKYTVRVVYDRGESDHSNEFSTDMSGIENIVADIDPENEPVYDLRGIRVYELKHGQIYVARGCRFVYTDDKN